MKSLFFFSLLLLATCKGADTATSEKDGNLVPFQTLITASQSNIESPQQSIIRSQEELETIFSEINKTRKPGIPIPEIDFNKQIIAFVNLGQTSTGGYTVTVDKILMKKEKVVIYVGGKSPKPNENVTMMLTTPFTMVKLNKQILPIVFKPAFEK